MTRFSLVSSAVLVTLSWMAQAQQYTISTVAGNGTNGHFGDGGPAASAQLWSPNGVALDALGNLYIADDLNARIRKVTADGKIATIAGTGVSGVAGDGGPAANAQFMTPVGIALDAARSIYIADSLADRIRKVTPDGIIHPLAGGGSTDPANGGPATGASLSYPEAVAVDGSGNLYIADYGSARILKVAVNGSISVVAGGGQPFGFQLGGPAGVAVDAAGNLYFTDPPTARVIRIAPNGQFTRLAVGYLSNPTGVAVDASGNVYITDTLLSQVFKVSPDGTVATIAGDGSLAYSGDGGLATLAGIGMPQGLAVDAAGRVYFADSIHSVVRLLTPQPSVPALGINQTYFPGVTAGQTGYTYSVSIYNGNTAAPTTGTVSVDFEPSSGLTLVSISGTGWTCSASTCSRGDPLSGGASYPAIAVTLNVSALALGTLTIQTTAWGGGSASVGATAQLYAYGPLSAPLLIAPANGATGVSVATALSWSPVNGAAYSVYLGTSSPPPPLANIGSGIYTYTPGTLQFSTRYYWQVTAFNVGVSDPSPIWSFTTAAQGACSYLLGAASGTASAAGGSASVTVTAPAGCAWTANSNSAWLTLLSLPTGTGNGPVNYLVAPNPGPGWRSGSLTIAGQTFTVTQAASAMLSVNLTRSGSFTQGQTNASYSITVSNLTGAGATIGPVTVAESLSSGLTLVSMSGTGWSCGSGACTRSDVLSAGASYPPIAVLVNVAANAPSQVTNQATVSGGGSLVASASDLASVATTLPVPSINPGGLANAASFAPGEPVAPGSIAAVFGSFQLNSPSAASSLPLPTSLSSLSVQFGVGINAPLFYASTGQVNLQVPWELAGVAQAPLTAMLDGQTSLPQTMNLAPFAPGIFTTSAQGTGQGAILDANSRLVDASNPATPGSVVVIYCTGLGPVSNQPASGFPAPGDPLAETLTKPTVTIGGATVTAAFAGLVPGLVGEYQVNAEVPAGSATGNAVPVAIAIGGVSSNTVTMAVKAAE